MNQRIAQSVLRLAHFVFWGSLLLLAMAWLASTLVPRVPGYGGYPKPTVDFIDAIYKGATPVLIGVITLSVIPMVLVWLGEDPVLRSKLYRQRHCWFGAVLGIAGLLAWGGSVGWLILDRGELELAIKRDHEAAESHYYRRGQGAPDLRAFQVRQDNEMRLPYLLLLGRAGMLLAAVGGLYFLVSWVGGHIMAETTARRRLSSPAVPASVEIIEAELVRRPTDAAGSEPFPR